jgi:hypothetical protein
MTSIKSIKHLNEGYNFLTTFIKNNINKFLVLNQIQRTIELIKSNSRFPQKSKIWYKTRNNLVTASSVSSIIMKSPKYKSYEEYINDKALNYAGISTFYTNKFTKFGNIFEFVAQKLLTMFRNTPLYKFYEAGLYINDNNTIGASPDGFIIKIDKHSSSGLSLDNLYKNNLILDTCLVEIKCPSRYIPIIKSVKDEKPHYYWQIQQQLYVTKLKYCIFMNNKFEYLSKNKYHQSKNLYKGVFFKIKSEKKTFYEYPDNIIDGNIDILHHNILKKYVNYIVKIKYWQLLQYDISEVEYDKKLYESFIPKIEKARLEFIEKGKNIDVEQYKIDNFMIDL